jgi:hydroxyacylglutathione hydrolase
MPIQAKIALEDGVVDILNKAQRGLRLPLEELAERADLPPDRIQAILSGSQDPEALERIAFALNLDAPALQRLADAAWYPQDPPEMDGFAMFTTDFGDMTVNAYLVWDPATREAASFDTGSSCQGMLETLRQQQLTLRRIFITHTHLDHLADLERLRRETQAVSYGSAVENPLGLKPLSHGDGLALGNLRIRVLGTSGHTPGGLSYFIQGLAKPLVVVGDALFAGSMGGAPQAYQEALQNNRRHILSLPDETVICPGHGPLTTVGEEKAHNPFFCASDRSLLK